MQVVIHSSDLQTCAQLLRTLTALGTDVVPTDPSSPLVDVPTAVVISSTILASPNRNELLDRLRTLPELIPINVAGRTEGFLDDLSQLFVDRLGVEEVARRVALTARLSGSDITAWNRLAARAAEWSIRRDPKLLLDQQEVDRARLILRRPVATEDLESAQAIASMVVASEILVRSRRRRWLRLIAVAVAVSVLVAALAGVSAWSASRAGSEAASQTDATDSRRLMHQALGSIDLDPDLPLILAGASASRSLSDQTLIQGRQVVASTVPHQTFSLGHIPAGLSTAASSHVAAVTYRDDQRVDVVDLRNGSVIASPARRLGDETADTFMISPDGQRLLLWSADFASPPRLVLLDGDTASIPSALNHALPLAWADPTTVVLLDPDGIVSWKVTTGDVDQLASANQEPSSVTASAYAPGQRLLALADAQEVRVIDLKGHGEVGHVALKRASALSFDANGSVLVGVSATVGSTVRPNPADGWSAPTLAPLGANMASVAPLPGSGFVIGETNGRVFLSGSGSDATVIELQAHLSDTVEVGASGADTFVTAGLDRRLRVWSPPARAVPTFNNRQITPLQYSSIYAAPADEHVATRRTPCDAQQLLTYSGPAGLAVIDPTTLISIGNTVDVPGLVPKLVFSPDGSHAFVEAESPFLVALGCDGTTTTTASVPVDTLGQLESTWALSNSGRYLAIAASNDVEVYDTSDGSTIASYVGDEVTKVGNPLAASVSDDGVAFVVGSSGTFNGSDASGQSLAGAAGGTALTGAVLTGGQDGFAVSRDERVYRIRGGQLEDLSSLADASQSSDLNGLTDVQRHSFEQYGFGGLHERPQLTVSAGRIAVVADGQVELLDDSTGDELFLYAMPDADTALPIGNELMITHDDGTITPLTVPSVGEFVRDLIDGAPRVADHDEILRYSLGAIDE